MAKYNNFKSALADGRTRTIFIGGLVIVVVITMFAIFSYASKKSSTRPSGPASEVARLPTVQNDSVEGAPHGSTPVYDKLIRDQNDREAEVAKETGGSAVPVMRAGVEKAPEPQKPATPAQTTPPPQQYTPPDTSRQEEEQKRQQAIAARVQAMKGQVNLLVTAWGPKEHIQIPLQKENQRGESSSGERTASTSSAVQSSLASASTREPARKAGDTCYAELDTAVNTDEPSPVTATIHQCGELDQAKLVGKVEVAQNAQYSQKAVLHFTTINVPGQPTSLTIDAYAMDEATRRTALASNVDNHYFLRYGSLFASAFMSGFGDALIKGGQSQQLVTTTTGAVVQQDAYTTQQMLLAGLGNVGKQAASNMGNVFNRPATITVNAGIGIGVLFMSDLTLK